VSASPPSVYPVLATPFGVVSLPEVEARNAALAALLTERAARDPGISADHPCYQSHDDLLDWPEPDVQTASRAMVRGLISVIATVCELPPVQLASLTLDARAWFVIVRPDGAMPARIRRLASWCGFYCVAAPERSPGRFDSGTLRLYESRLGTMFSDATNSTMRQPFTPGHSAWTPVPGALAVFPASVTHEIALLKSTTPLIALMLKARFVAPDQEGWKTW